MKRILFIVFVCFGFLAKGQVFTPMTAAGYQNKRTKTDSTNYIPTFPGFPTLRSTTPQKQAAIAADSTNKVFYWYDPKTETWNALGTGSGSIINIFNDTTIIICPVAGSCDTIYTTVIINDIRIENDSTLIICPAVGDCDTIHIPPTQFGASVVFYGKNASDDSTILLLSNGVRFAASDNSPPCTISNGILSGGIVTWLHDYVYNVSEAFYNIDCITYHSPSTDFTLDAADPTLDRIDIFNLTTSNTAVVVSGTPGSGIPPDYDANLQFNITFALVSAGTTEPVGASNNWIYQENISPPEWQTSLAYAQINPNSTNNPYAGTKTIEGTSVPNSAYIDFTAPTTPDMSAYDVLTFQIRSKANFSTTKKLVFRWLTAPSTATGNNVVLGQGSYGFISTQTASYQTITIPLSDFGALPANVNLLRITQSNTSGTGGWYIDNIQLQKAGIANPENFVTDVTKNTTGDSFYVWKNGVVTRRLIDSIGNSDSAIQAVYNYFSDTSFTNQFQPNSGVIADTIIRLTDSTIRYIYTDGTQVDDTSRIAFTQENIQNILNIFNYIDSVNGEDTTFIRGPTVNGLPFAYNVEDALSPNDTLHFDFPHNNVSVDSVLSTDADGNLIMKLVTGGGGGSVNNTGSGYRLVTGDGALIKSVNHDLTLTIDSLTSGELTFKVDTAQIATQFDLTQIGGVETVTGSIAGVVDNTDPVNPVVNAVEVDGVTITGTGVTGDPLVAVTGGSGTVTNVTGSAPIIITGTSTITPNVTVDTSTNGTGLATIYKNNLNYSTASIYHDSILVLARPNGSTDSITMRTSTSPGWSTTGNSATITGTNFLGTKDDEPLMFKVNNHMAGFIDSVSAHAGRTYLGLGAGDNNTDRTLTSVGFGAARNNTSGWGNTALGNKALFTNVIGSNNTAIGDSALLLATGASNTAVGYTAGGTLTTATTVTLVGMGAQSSGTGSFTSAVGYNACKTCNGNQNTALGREALGGATETGAANTALGYHALFNNTSGANNIGLGINAGRNNTTATRQLYISSKGDLVTNVREQNESIIYGQQVASTPGTSQLTQYLTVNGKLGINKIIPTAYLHLTRGTEVANTAPLKFDAPASLTTTAASGDGTNATLTFASTTNPPFVQGSTIVVTGVTPAGYNTAGAIVSTVTATTVTYANTTTGSQTVAGAITQGALLTTPEAGAVEYDGSDFYATPSSATRYYINKVLKGSGILDFGSVASLGNEILTITVTGAADGDAVYIGVPNGSMTAGLVFTAWVSAANTVSVQCYNSTLGPIDPNSGTFKAVVSQ